MEYRWDWPWYRILLLYVCGMILGAALVLLLYRLRHAESVVVPVLGAVAMLLATANEIRAAWRGRGPEDRPAPAPPQRDISTRKQPYRICRRDGVLLYL